MGKLKMKRNWEEGFTLIETLIGVSILAFGSLALAQLLFLGTGLNVRTKDDTELATMATQYMESISQVSYRNLVVGGSLNPAPGTEDPAYSDLNVNPENVIPSNNTLHKSDARYDVYWQISDGGGGHAGAPYKVINVRVVSKRLKNINAPSREVTLMMEIVNQFAI